MPAPDLIVCSHRGPYAYTRTARGLVGRRGGGGLIGAIAPVMDSFGGTWIAAAMSPEDREVAHAEPGGRQEEGFRLRLLDLPEDVHSLHYDTVSNEYLWFFFHYLFDVPFRPAFDASFARAWDAYREINRRYAEAIRDAGPSDAVLVEDYHLMLVGAELRRRSRRRAPLLYFHHTPWCEPDYFSLLPDAVTREILGSLCAYDVVGFHARRWADAFLACCQRLVPGARVNDDVVSHRGRETRVIVAPVPIDADNLKEQASSPRAERWMEWLEEMARGRRLLVRVDRIDLSKNALRGYLAFEALLERRPELAEDTVFLALQYPSRMKVDKYRRYLAECMSVVRRVNERFAERAPGDEGPLGLHMKDDFSRSLAAMRSYDAMIVNPVFDGLNMVSKEGGAINERDGVVILSRNAGAFEEIGSATLNVNPFDILETSEAIEQALEMPGAERARRARRLARLATATGPEDWARIRLGAAGISL